MGPDFCFIFVVDLVFLNQLLIARNEIFNILHVQARWPMASFSFKEGLIRQKNVEKLQLRLMVPFYLRGKS